MLLVQPIKPMTRAVERRIVSTLFILVPGCISEHTSDLGAILFSLVPGKWESVPFGDLLEMKDVVVC